MGWLLLFYIPLTYLACGLLGQLIFDKYWQEKYGQHFYEFANKKGYLLMVLFGVFGLIASLTYIGQIKEMRNRDRRARGVL